MLVFPNPLRGLQHRKGPKGGSQGSATSVHKLFFPSPRFPDLHTPSLCLLCSVPPADAFFFFFSFTSYRSLNPYFSSSTLCFPSLSFHVSPRECWWQRFPYSRAAVQPRSQITERERERGFTFPEKPNLSSVQCCDAWQPNWVAFFFSHSKTEHSQRSAHTQAPNQRRRIFLIFFAVVEFCRELAAMWPLPQMLRRSKPARINISG